MRCPRCVLRIRNHSLRVIDMRIRNIFTNPLVSYLETAERITLKISSSSSISCVSAFEGWTSGRYVYNFNLRYFGFCAQAIVQEFLLKIKLVSESRQKTRRQIHYTCTLKFYSTRFDFIQTFPEHSRPFKIQAGL